MDGKTIYLSYSNNVGFRKKLRLCCGGATLNDWKCISRKSSFAVLAAILCFPTSSPYMPLSYLIMMTTNN